MAREGELAYFANPPEYAAEKLIWKSASSADEAKKHLEWIMETLKNSPPENFSDMEKVKSLIFDYATENGRGQVLWPLRYALSGKDKSPDPFTLIYILGKEESLARIANAVQKLSN